MNMKKLSTVVLTLLLLGAHPLLARELADGEWTVRLALTADFEDIEDSYNTLGQLSDALPDYDRMDLHELGQPFAGTYLSVIFYRPDWEPGWATEDAVYQFDWVDFNTDYHPISTIPDPSGCTLLPPVEPGDEWTFEVRSNDTARDLTLTWVGSEGADLERMVLVDLQEGITVPAAVGGVPQAYSFRMNSAVRGFAWRLLSDAEYEASGTASAAPAPFGATSARSAASDAFPAEGSATTSDWLPMGWSPDTGDGSGQAVPEGLPEDPFAD